MDLNRFRECAEAYGADRRRWPAREHGLYDRFAGTPEGAAILAEAERADRFLDAFEVAGPDEALARRVATPASSRRRGADQAGKAAGRRRRTLWWQATAFVASAILGFAIGFAQVADEPAEDVVAQFLFGPAGAREIGL